jgi:hypothetical protein
MIKLAIEFKQSAFLPEAHAYKAFFESKGWQCELLDPSSKGNQKYDVIILFHGIHPFWKSYPKIVVGEYHSLSTGRFPRIKDAIKRLINKPANLNVFLNERVRSAMWFSANSSNNLLRPMGVCYEEYEKIQNSAEFDIVYAGSYRKGLDKVIASLKDLGYKIAIAGFTGQSCTLVKYFGKLSAAETRSLIKKSRLGLNFTPDVWPYNVQDSTKVLEYCAAGIPIVTNNYEWIRNFQDSRDCQFLDLYEFISTKKKDDFDLQSPNISDLDWGKVIINSGLYEKLNRELNSNLQNK